MIKALGMQYTLSTHRGQRKGFAVQLGRDCGSFTHDDLLYDSSLYGIYFLDWC